jgi:adenine-specific DNA-methyltransferase
VLSSDGSICWQVGNYVENGEIFPLDIFYYPVFKALGMRLRNRIVWHFGHGLHASKRFSGRYETLLWFTKSDTYTFNLDAVRIPSKYPGKRHYKGPKKGQLSGNPKGKNPSDIWLLMAQEWEMGLWDIPNVKANHPEKTIHPAQFPIELVERCVLAMTDKDDWVFDPYAGVGSALIAAIKQGRRAMGSEKEEQYVQIAHERINSFFSGELKIRPLGKPVYRPTGREKVAQIPDEWKQASFLATQGDTEEDNQE